MLVRLAAVTPDIKAVDIINITTNLIAVKCRKLGIRIETSSIRIVRDTIIALATARIVGRERSMVVADRGA